MFVYYHMHMGVLSASMSGTCKIQERRCDPLGVELQRAVNHYVGAESRNRPRPSSVLLLNNLSVPNLKHCEHSSYAVSSVESDFPHIQTMITEGILSCV